MPPKREQEFKTIIEVVLPPWIEAQVVVDTQRRLVISAKSPLSPGVPDADLLALVNDLRSQVTGP